MPGAVDLLVWLHSVYFSLDLVRLPLTLSGDFVMYAPLVEVDHQATPEQFCICVQYLPRQGGPLPAVLQHAEAFVLRGNSLMQTVRELEHIGCSSGRLISLFAVVQRGPPGFSRTTRPPGLPPLDPPLDDPVADLDPLDEPEEAVHSPGDDDLELAEASDLVVPVPDIPEGEEFTAVVHLQPVGNDQVEVADMAPMTMDAPPSVLSGATGASDGASIPAVALDVQPFTAAEAAAAVDRIFAEDGGEGASVASPSSPLLSAITEPASGEDTLPFPAPGNLTAAELRALRSLALRVHYRIRDQRGGAGDALYELANWYTTLRYLATEIPIIEPPTEVQQIPIAQPAQDADVLTPLSEDLQQILED